MIPIPPAYQSHLKATKPWRFAAVSADPDYTLMEVAGQRLAFTKSAVIDAEKRAARLKNPVIFPDDVLFDCPACQHRLVTASENVHHAVTCPCGEQVIVPAANEPRENIGKRYALEP